MALYPPELPPILGLQPPNLQDFLNLELATQATCISEDNRWYESLAIPSTLFLETEYQEYTEIFIYLFLMLR